MPSMKPWMEGIGDADLDESPDDELSPELLRTVRRLSETLKKLDLRALASTVAGSPHRILVIRPPADEEEPWALLDPVIESVGISRSDELEECLCLPGLRVRVPRPRTVVLRARTLSQTPVRLKVGGALARIFQHQLDHLDGILPTEWLQEELRETLPDSVLRQPTACLGSL